MNRRQKIIVSVTGIFIVLLALLGLTFAYFLTQIRGNEETKSISVTTANLVLEYGDGNNIITMSNIMPGDPIPTKTFTVTNRGNGTVENYKVYLENVINQLERKTDLTYTLTCKSYKTTDTTVDFSTLTEDGECIGTDETTFPSALTNITTNTIGVGYTHYYELKLVYEDTGTDQSVDMNKLLSAKINIYDERVNFTSGKYLLLNDLTNQSKPSVFLTSDKITDFSNVSVTATGANVLNIDAMVGNGNGFYECLSDNGDGTYTLTKTHENSNYRFGKKQDVFIPANTSIYFYADIVESDADRIGIQLADSAKSPTKYQIAEIKNVGNGRYYQIITKFDVRSMWLYIPQDTSVGGSATFKNMQLVISDSVPTSYIPYKSQTVKAKSNGNITGLNTINPTMIISTNSDEVTLNTIKYESTTLSLQGKTIVNFGDSIFGMYSAPIDISSYLAEKTGATVYNVGFSGCRMANHPTAAYDAFSMDSLADAVVSQDFSTQETALSNLQSIHTSNFTTRLNTLKSSDFNDVDIVTIAYGSNDLNAWESVSNPNNKYDRDYFTGSLRYSIETLKNAYPNLKIVLCTPLYRFWMDDEGNFTEDSDTYVNGGGLSMSHIVNAVKTIGLEYGLLTLDLYNESGINYDTRNTYFDSNDGTHPNVSGRKLMAKYMADKLLREYGN